MPFNSFNFWIVFPFIFALYWAIPSSYRKAKKWFLILVSYLLYMNFKPAYALILLGVTVVTYFAAIWMESISIAGDKKKRKAIVWTGVVLVTLPLLVFKYYNFINESLFGVMDFIGVRFNLPGLNWAVPVGISFFTFQALGYMLDVYFGKIKAERNFSDYLLFCSFFPQTASGPISKANELLPQIKNPHSFSYERARYGLQILLWGMFLKVVFADRLGIYVDTVYDNVEHYSGITCLVASIFYSFQIYGDFAGYSLMAIGIGKILGFDLVNNFNRPYLASSITDFWKRWHISLTRWLTSYIYIPLGGNRCSKVKQYWNIMVTFLVSGIWHGANWTFIVWGAIHGVLQIVEKILGIDPKGRLGKAGENNIIIKAMRIVVTFSLVTFAWVFFRSPSIGTALQVVGKIFTNGAGAWQAIGYAPVMMIMFLLVVGREFIEEFSKGRISLMNNRFPAIRWCSYLFLFSFIILYGVLDSTQFIYVSF